MNCLNAIKPDCQKCAWVHKGVCFHPSNRANNAQIVSDSGVLKMNPVTWLKTCAQLKNGKGCKNFRFS